jgi:hypothetical protein
MADAAGVAAFIKWRSENAKPVLSFLGGAASVATFFQTSPAAQRWWANIKLNKFAKKCQSPDGTLNLPNSRHGRYFVANKTLKTVLDHYVAHAIGFPENGFVMVACTLTGMGKTTCARAFTKGNLQYLPPGAIFIDLQAIETGNQYPEFVKKLGFSCEWYEKDSTKEPFVRDLLCALSGEVGAPRDLKEAYEAFKLALNPFKKAQLAVADALDSAFKKLAQRAAQSCGGANDVNDDSIMAILDQRSPSDDDAAPADPDPDLGRSREVRLPDQSAIIKSDLLTEALRPIAVLCIDNVPKLDDDLANFFVALKGAIWDYSYNNKRVICLVTTRYEETAEKLRKMNRNEKISLVTGSYVGNARDDVATMTFTNFNWGAVDFLEHFTTKYRDLSENRPAEQVLIDASQSVNIRTGEYHASTHLREIPDVEF